MIPIWRLSTFGIDRAGRGGGVRLHLRGQLVQHRGHAAHFLQLAQLIAQIRQIEGLALADLLGELLRLFLVDLLLHLLDQRQHVAHPEDARGDALGLEQLERLGLLAGADEQDRLAGHLAHRQRRAAAGIAVGLGEDHAGQAQGLVERLGGVDGILAGHAVDDEQPLVRIAAPPRARSPRPSSRRRRAGGPAVSISSTS